MAENSGAFMARIHRRNLLRLAGSLPALTGSSALAAAPQRIVAVVEPGAAASAPVTGALDQLRRALAAQGSHLETVPADAVGAAALVLVLATPGAVLTAGFPAARSTATVPEQFRIAPGTFSGTPALLVSG